MNAAKSVVANFTGFTGGAAASGLQVRSLGKPAVSKFGARWLMTIRFSTNRDGLARLTILRANQPFSTISFAAQQGQVEFGPFLLPRSGVYQLVLVFTDLSGHTKTLRWDACLGVRCPKQTTTPAKPTTPTTPPTPTTGGLKVVKGAAKTEKLAKGANVTLLFSTNQFVNVTVDIFRGTRKVLENLRFSFKAGPVALGPFTVTEGGTYRFELTAVDRSGRRAQLSWTVVVPA
jgi:hypothetical protein